MKRVLIISPYFPPSNTADMQRVRMSLPFFKAFGWAPEVAVVADAHSRMPKDPLLLESIPADVPIHTVEAFSQRWTSKLGLGSLGLRSLWYYRRRVNRLLRQKTYDLIYFSTTEFPVCILGAYWKKKFGVPYVIDMQDPWHSDFYQDKPRSERPPKYWFSYRLHKYLEPLAMNKVGGLISVSAAYIQALEQRYPHCTTIPRKTITFGAFEQDLQIARRHQAVYPPVVAPATGKKAIVYVGRGGHDMQAAVRLLFTAFSRGLQQQPALFSSLHFHFIGTSYAAGGGQPTIHPVAEALGVGEHVTEVTRRIPFYQTLNTLAGAAALFIPGSTDAQYTASKIYPYVQVQKPLLAIFHEKSSVVTFLKAVGAGQVFTFHQPEEDVLAGVQAFLLGVGEGSAVAAEPDPAVLDLYSARKMTERQCAVFDEVVK